MYKILYRILEEENVMKYKKVYAIGLLLSLISFNTVYAKSNFSYSTPELQPSVQNNYNYQQPMTYNNQPLRGSVITVPAGSCFSATLTSGLSSANATVGQAVYMNLGKDFYYGDKLVAPAGSMVMGTVTAATSAKHGSMNGKLAVRFTQITTPMGTQIPISAVIKTNDNSGVLSGGTKMDVTKEYVKDMAVGSAAGALSGLVFGALAGGDKLGRGVALGTAVGAGGGLVKSAIDKGADVEIPANSTIDLYVTQPITVSASNYSFEN